LYVERPNSAIDNGDALIFPASSICNLAQQQATRRFLASIKTGPRCCDPGAILPRPRWQRSIPSRTPADAVRSGP
jgi:hypothetical protein